MLKKTILVCAGNSGSGAIHDLLLFFKNVCKSIWRTRVQNGQ